MLVLAIGTSGSGKTTAIRNLDPKETYVVSIAGKVPPLRGASLKYKTGKGGNLYLAKQPKDLKEFKSYIDKIFKIIDYVNEAKEFKNLIIDDVQYYMSFEIFARAYEKGYQKYTEVATHLVDLLRKLSLLRDDLNVVLTWHEEVKDNGVIGAKTAGKMIDSTLTVEGLFNYVVRASRKPTEFNKDNGFCFIISEEGSSAKLPQGVFEADYIPNDYNILFKALRAYEHDEEYNWEADYIPTKKLQNSEM
jgi:hypothetical protein